jgi:hypothetical protein
MVTFAVFVLPAIIIDASDRWRSPQEWSGWEWSLSVLGLLMRNWWLAAAGVMAHVYSVGLAGWDEEADLRGRFGAAWLYRTAVGRWIPLRRPWHPPNARPPRLFVSESCGCVARSACGSSGETSAISRSFRPKCIRRGISAA